MRISVPVARSAEPAKTAGLNPIRSVAIECPNEEVRVLMIVVESGWSGNARARMIADSHMLAAQVRALYTRIVRHDTPKCMIIYSPVSQ